MRHITYALLLAMLVVLAACTKENLEKDNTTNVIPKEGLELLTTDADANYFIWASKKDTFMYRSSDGLNFEMLNSFAFNSGNERLVQYRSVVECPTGPYKNIGIMFTCALKSGENLDTASLEHLLIPGRYNVGERTGEVYMRMDSRAYALQGWTDISSTDMPIEVISVTKVGFRNKKNVYRVRARVVTKCEFGCPLVWISMYQGAFQFDVY